MNKVAIVAVIAVIAVVGAVIYLDHESRVEYSVETNDLADDIGDIFDVANIGDIFDVATFTVKADLDEEKTVTLWCDGEKLSSLGNSEWVAEAGEWEQTFVVDISDLGLTVDGFYDRLTVEFDGKEGRLV